MERLLPRLEPYDPLQVFSVKQMPCMLLHVKVIRGRKISNGWVNDLLDTPDPYVRLTVKSAPDGRRRTRTIDNDVNPEWHESFTFLLNFKSRNILQIQLMEAGIIYDDIMGSVSFNIGELTLNEKEIQTFSFGSAGEVDMELLIEFDTQPSLRYSLCIGEEEIRYRHIRTQRVMEGMRRLLGKDGPHTKDEVPVIGVLGSGGGFRAMTGMSGAFKALHDTGVLDTVMYTAGLSGSSWYIAQLYSHPDFPKKSPGELNKELQANIDRSLLWLLSPQSVYKHLDQILRKRTQGQPVSFTDFFGHLVGETLLKGRLDSKLSEQCSLLENAEVPMPLYTCVHVKKDVSARVFQEWMEFSPYEVGMPKYGVFMPSQIFGSKFFMGKLVRKFEEQPLHYLMGIWGSAFTILFQRLMKDNTNKDPVEQMRLDMEAELDRRADYDSSDSSDISDSEEESAPPVKKVKLCKKHAAKKPVLKRQDSKQRTKQMGFWRHFLESTFKRTNLTMLSTRAGRAGVIHNPLRGLALNRNCPFSPFTPLDPVTSVDEFDGIFEMQDTDVKRLYLVDAGLTFNTPYPLLLRPMRTVDIFFSFDFSGRPSDDSEPFKELLLAQKWAHMNGVKFPPIDPDVFKREGMKELYVFKDKKDPHCPVIMHFVLINKEFRKFKAPGVPRETKEEQDFANFSIFDDPSTPYSTFNFNYSKTAFDRLSQLTEFNVLLNLERIKAEIKDCIVKKRQASRTLTVQPAQMPLLKIKSAIYRKQLKQHMDRQDHLRLHSKSSISASSYLTADLSSDQDTLSEPDTPDVFTNDKPSPFFSLKPVPNRLKRRK